jgi:hypothetical protein
MTKTYAVLDGYAVSGPVRVLVGPEEREMQIDSSALPPDAKEGSVFQVLVENDRIIEIHVDPERKTQIQRRLEEKRRALLKRGPVHRPDKTPDTQI